MRKITRITIEHDQVRTNDTKTCGVKDLSDIYTIELDGQRDQLSITGITFHQIDASVIGKHLYLWPLTYRRSVTS